VKRPIGPTDADLAKIEAQEAGRLAGLTQTGIPARIRMAKHGADFVRAYNEARFGRRRALQRLLDRRNSPTINIPLPTQLVGTDG